jgi:hypothetical protein
MNAPGPASGLNTTGINHPGDAFNVSFNPVGTHQRPGGMQQRPDGYAQGIPR